MQASWGVRPRVIPSCNQRIRSNRRGRSLELATRKCEHRARDFVLLLRRIGVAERSGKRRGRKSDLAAGERERRAMGSRFVLSPFAFAFTQCGEKVERSSAAVAISAAAALRFH